jgi:hypothetical protein
MLGFLMPNAQADAAIAYLMSLKPKYGPKPPLHCVTCLTDRSRNRTTIIVSFLRWIRIAASQVALARRPYLL